MKIKFTSILFLFVIVAPVMATFFWMKYQESVVKHEVKLKLMAGIDKRELVLLKFTKDASKNELHWEHAGEFEYNSQMYDIVETQSAGDSIFYWCWPDTKESQLKNKFTALVNDALGSTPLQKEKQEQIISYFKSLYCLEHISWQMTPAVIINIYPGNNAFSFFSSYLFAPFSPPPELT